MSASSIASISARTSSRDVALAGVLFSLTGAMQPHAAGRGDILMCILVATTTTDLIEAELRRRIERGELAPAARLADAKLAAELGVSRTPVREALLRLAREGLVEIAPGRWTQVS